MSDVVIDTSGSQLDARSTQTIVDHVKLRWKLSGCALCESKSFVLLAQVTMRYYDQPKIIRGKGPEHPCAAIVCRDCGDVKLLDLIVAGIWAPPQADGEVVASSGGPYR